MLLLAGTIPVEGLPLTYGRVSYLGDKLTIGDYTLEGQYVTLGTAAMISAASVVSQALGAEDPLAFVIGDTGMGEGTVTLLKHLTDELSAIKPSVVTLHYILPTRDTFINFVEAAHKMEKRPFMIADAGALLNAKAVKLAQKFDLFTPDPGEISFLADPDAAHPAYVQHFIFDVDQTEVPRLSQEAYANGDAPKYMIVKAPIDHVIVDGQVAGVIKEPSVPAMEPIGGTGDTITGEVSALIAFGLPVVEACTAACKINRVAGELTKPNPATTIAQFIPFIREAAKKVVVAKG
ncbi:MAG: sugar kinase [Dehalococcoidia bacterium]|nr:sugar kinase [Dehalococcoidia bacterium]